MSDKKVKARKEYSCDYCGGHIKKGEIYTLFESKEPKYDKDNETQIGIIYYRAHLHVKCPDTCEYCGQIYDPDEQGHKHDPDCECCYCDPGHVEHDKINAAPILTHVQEFGRLCFCCQECECNFVRERTG